jgi:hypothetical protein
MSKCIYFISIWEYRRILDEFYFPVLVFFFKGFFLSVDASYEQMTKTARVNDEHMRTECESSMKRRALRVLYLWVNLEMYFGAYAFPFSVSGWLGCMAKDSLSLSPRPRTCVAYYRWFSGCESCASAWFKVGYRKTGEGRPPLSFTSRSRRF